MYLFVYKTTHKNGRFYIGKHETKNINDGYLGSGNWVKSIKNKTNLSREILAEASSVDELKNLEEYWISLYYDDPMNMNFKRASVGLTSKDASERMLDRIARGESPLQNVEVIERRKLGSSLKNKKLHSEGKLSIQQPESMKRVAIVNAERGSKQMKDGTHPLLSFESKENSMKKLRERIIVSIEQGNWGYQNEAIRHKVLQVQSQLISNGMYHTQTTEFAQHQSNIQKKLVEDGNHMTQVKWECGHCGKTGKGLSNYNRWHGNNCKSKT